MRLLKIFVVVLLLPLISCSSYNKNTFRNEYDDNVLYSTQSNCEIFQNHNYKEYSPNKCFKIKYNFDKKSYRKLRNLYYVVFLNGHKENKKKIKEFPFYKVYKSVNIDNDTLINKNGYGLYYVSGKVIAPNFYFLRTRNYLYHYNCTEKKLFIKKLEKSNAISDKLKNKIKNFIKQRCETESGLKWYSGARFN